MGHVVDERKARKSGCVCYELPKGELMCYSPGAVGTLTDAQERLFCNEEDLNNPQNASDELVGMQKLFSETVKRAESRYIELPEEERSIDTWGKLLGQEFQTFMTPPKKRRGFRGDKKQTIDKKRQKAPKDVKIVERKPSKVEDLEEVEVEQDYDWDIYEKGGYKYWELYDLVKFGEKVTGIRFEPQGKKGTKDEFYQYIDDNAEDIFPDVEFEDGHPDDKRKEAEYDETNDLSYEDIENESKTDLIAMARDDNIKVKKSLGKDKIVSVLAEEWGVFVPYEKRDVEDLLTLAKSKGYKGRSKTKDDLVYWLTDNERTPAILKDSLAVETKEPVFYSLDRMTKEEKKIWNKAIKTAPKKFNKLYELIKDLPQDTELMYKLRDRIDSLDTDEEITSVGKKTLIRTIDSRIGKVSASARVIEGRVPEDEEYVPSSLKIKRAGIGSKKAIDERDITFTEIMDGIVRFSGDKKELDSLKSYVERMDNKDIRGKDKKKALALIEEKYGTIKKDRKKKDSGRKPTKKEVSVSDDVSDVNVSEYMEDVEEIDVRKKKIMSMKEARGIAKAKAEESYNRAYEDLVRKKAIESDGAIVELTAEEERKLRDFRRDMEKWNVDNLKKQFIIVGKEKTVVKEDTTKLKNDFINKIESSVSIGRLEELDAMLEEKYLEGDNKKQLKKLIRDARATLLGEEVPQDAEEEQETVEGVEEQAVRVETPVKRTSMPSETKQDEKDDITKGEVTKYTNHIMKAKNVGRLDEIGKNLLKYNIDDDVQELITKLTERKEEILGITHETAEPIKVSEIVDMRSGWDGGSISQKMKVLRYLYEKEGTTPQRLLDLANKDWDGLPQKVKDDVVSFYVKKKGSEATIVEKSKGEQIVSATDTKTSEVVKQPRDSKQMSEDAHIEKLGKKTSVEPTTVEKVQLDKLSYTDLGKRLQKLQNIKSQRGKLTPKEIGEEIYEIEMMMPAITKDRMDYYRASLMPLKSKDSVKIDALEKEWEKDDALDETYKKTVKLWIDGRRTA